MCWISDTIDQWAPDISYDESPSGAVPTCNNPGGSGPGAMAATRLRNEVAKYILSQNGTIPVTAKIMTRVFCNFSSRQGLMKSFRKRGLAGLSLPEFAVQFTEKLPLFDFFDAGRGKERVDDKIRGKAVVPPQPDTRRQLLTSPFPCRELPPLPIDGQLSRAVRRGLSR